MPPHRFFANISNTAAPLPLRRQIWVTCAKIKNTPCVQILTSQVKRSGLQVRSKTDVHSGTGFKLEDRAVGTVLVQMFSNFQDEVLKWISTEFIFRICHFSDLRSGQFSTRPVITVLWENYSFAHNFWTRDDRRMEWVPICLSCGPESNDTQYDQRWPDLTCDPKLGRLYFEMGGKVVRARNFQTLSSARVKPRRAGEGVFVFPVGLKIFRLLFSD